MLFKRRSVRTVFLLMFLRSMPMAYNVSQNHAAVLRMRFLHPAVFGRDYQTMRRRPLSSDLFSRGRSRILTVSKTVERSAGVPPFLFLFAAARRRRAPLLPLLCVRARRLSLYTTIEPVSPRWYKRAEEHYRFSCLPRPPARKNSLIPSPGVFQQGGRAFAAWAPLSVHALRHRKRKGQSPQ